MKNLVILLLSIAPMLLAQPPFAIPIRNPSSRISTKPGPAVKAALEIDLKSLCGGIDCIDRELTQHIIANNLLTTQKKFTVILGEVGSGKTVILTRLENELRASTDVWTIAVDLTEAAPNSISPQWNPEDVLFVNLGEAQKTQLKNALINNPATVNFVLDNIDKVPTSARVKILDYLAANNKRGVGVVISSTKRLGWTPSISPTDTVIEIPQLSASETEVFLTRHWDSEFGLSNSYKHGDYAKAVAKVLEESSLPRSFNTAKQLVQLLSDGDAVIFGDKQNFLTVKDYVNGKVSNAFAVVEMLETMKLNKFRLFEKLTAPLSESAASYYGATALESMLSITVPNHHPIVQEVKKAIKHTLDHRADERFDFIRSDSNDVEMFIHAEYENYFLAKYIIDEVKKNPETFSSTIRTLLGDSEYVHIAEHINAVLMEPEIKLNFKPALELISKSISLPMLLDNVLSYGLDNIASAIFENINNVPEIGKYFLNNVAKSKKLKFDFKYRFGMLSMSRERSSYERQEMLFRRGMEKTIEMLIRVETAQGAQRNQMWQTEKWVEYLKEFYLTQSRPSIKIYEMMKPYLETNLPPEVANELVFKAVDHGGLRNKPIIQDLIFRGATPPTISVAGETLAHLALKNRNPSLLKYIYEDLKVPIVDKTATKSLLITALDSNPLPRYSQPQFWETMEYFINHGDFKIPQPKNIKIRHLHVRPLVSDINSAAYALITGANDPKLLDQKINKLKVSPGILETLSPDVRNYRRNTVLSRGVRYDLRLRVVDRTVLTEILLKYRGLDNLDTLEQITYEKCIVSAVEYDNTHKKLSLKKQRRIIKRMIENIGTVTDYEFTEKFLDNPSIKNVFNEKVLRQAVVLLSNRLKSGMKNPKIQQRFELTSGVSLTRAQLHPEIVGMSAELKMASRRLNSDRKQESSSSFVCRSLTRRRRSANTHCLVTKSEYDEFVRVLEDHGHPNLVTLDTARYEKLLQDTKHVNEIKYNQLIEIGKRLMLEDHVVLVGEMSIFLRDNIVPSTSAPRMPKSKMKTSTNLSISPKFEKYTYSDGIHRPLLPEDSLFYINSINQPNYSKYYEKVMEQIRKIPSVSEFRPVIVKPHMPVVVPQRIQFSMPLARITCGKIG